jgi:small subunit ribosomal protein S4e
MAHLKRQKLTKKIPLPRKGTTFLAKANSDVSESVPAVIAVRDLLHLARNAKEVKLLKNEKKLKINGAPIKDIRQPIKILNVFEADKAYTLTLTSNGKFTFEPTKTKDQRLCKVTGKKIQKAHKIQLNLHDGSNIIISDKEKIKINDSIYIDFKGKLKSHVSLEKGKSAIVISGNHLGSKGKITAKDEETHKVTIEFNNKEGSAVIDAERVVVE